MDGAGGGGMEQSKEKQSFKVLLACDREREAVRLCHCLAALGHQVAGLATEGRAACRLHHELRPDLTILDQSLPVLNTMEVARRINCRDPLPVLLISEGGDSSPHPKAEASWVTAYIAPPWEPSLVGPALNLAWQNFQRLLRLKEQVRRLQRELGNRKVIERAKGVIMEKRGLSLDQARQTLEEEARRREVSLGEVARDLVSTQAILAK